MAGMHGFGRVEPEADEPVFHAPWEGRVFGLMIATGASGLREGQLRPAIESMAAPDYLEASYYERWLAAVEAGLAASGTVSAADVDARVAAPVDVAATSRPGHRRPPPGRAATSQRPAPAADPGALRRR